MKQMMNERAVFDTLVKVAGPMTKEGLDTELLRRASGDGVYHPTPTIEAIERATKIRAGRARRTEESKITKA